MAKSDGSKLGEEVLGPVNIDSVLNAYGTVSFIAGTTSAEHYRVTHKDGQLKATDFFFNIPDGNLQNITYYYKTGQVVIIDFIKFEWSEAFSAENFSESIFIAVDKENIRPARSYLSYKIIDGRSGYFAVD